MSIFPILLIAILFSCTGSPPTPADSAMPAAAALQSAPCAGCSPAASDGASAGAGRTLSGRVEGSDGAVAGASVVVSAAAKEVDFDAATTTGPTGHFSVRVPADGQYLVTAHHGRWGSGVTSVTVAADLSPPTVPLEAQPVSALGVLRDDVDQPIVGGRIELTARSGESQPRFAIVSDEQGRFELRLPSGNYFVVAHLGQEETAAVSVSLPLEDPLELRLFRHGASTAPALEQELAFVREHRRPVGEQGGVWTEAWLEGASVVALGEQTHGARDAIVARFELAKALISDHGFNVVALEAGYEGAWALGDWVRGERGDVHAAIEALNMWTWQTQETVEFVTWLRAQNALRGKANRIELVGIYGNTVFPLKLEALRDRLRASKVDARAQLLKAVPNINSCPELDPSFGSDERWLLARQRDPVIALMLDSIRGCKTPPAGDGAVERLAANTCQRILSMDAASAEQPRKMVLLAHNGHIARARIGRGQQDGLGQHLSQALGRRYRAVGMSLGSGKFTGAHFNPKTGYAKHHEPLELDALRHGSIEAVLNDGGQSYFLPLVAVDGRRWSGPARLMRDIGASFSPEYAEHYWSPVRLEAAYDAVLHIPHTEAVVERPWARP
jgi:erythromycin esterase